MFVVIVELFTVVLAHSVPPQKNIVSEWKCLPVSVNTNDELPAVALAGEIDVRTGTSAQAS
jgi:hypothetical protein